MIKVFFAMPAGEVQRSLRRFSNGPCSGGGEYSYHDATVPLDRVPRNDQASGDNWPHDDSRWPTACAKCGREFLPGDNWQLFHEALYRRTDTGEVMSWPQLPVGAVRSLSWLEGRAEYTGPDGRSLECKTPGGDWIIDSRAKNCTMPEDTAHKCWVRHGRPEDGTLHVDKNGLTCAAGAGSIATKTWHGFLHNGELIGA